MTDPTYEQRSWRELEAGRLPLRAQERLASLEADRAFTSDLTAAEHLAVRGVGFEPVGQVMGASVFQIGFTGAWDCGVDGYGVRQARWAGGPYGYGGSRPGPSWSATSAPRISGPNSWAAAMRGSGWVQGPYGWTFSALTCNTITVRPWRAALLEAQERAVSRLEQEVRALGGDGVVAVRFRENPLPNGAVEFHVIGTAVRGPGERRSRGTFSSALTGQDFARLVHAGWMPVRLLFGLAVMTRHDDLATQYARSSWRNVELGGFTQLVTDTRAEARLQMARKAATAGAEAAVLSASSEHVSEHECRLVEHSHDHVVRTTYLGTGLVRFRARGHSDALPPAVPVLRLDRTDPRTGRSDVEVP